MQLVIKNSPDKKSGQSKPVTKLQLIKFAVVALLATSTAIAVFIIGLLLVLPFVILGILWFVYMALRGKIRIHRDQF